MSENPEAVGSADQAVPWYKERDAKLVIAIVVTMLVIFLSCLSLTLYLGFLEYQPASLADFDRWYPEEFLTKDLVEVEGGESDLDNNRMHFYGSPRYGWEQYRLYIVENHQLQGWQLISDSPDDLQLINKRRESFRIIWKDDKVRLQNWF